MNSDNFIFDQEIMAQFVEIGARIAEVPVPTRYFAQASSASFMQSSRYGLSILWLLARFAAHSGVAPPAICESAPPVFGALPIRQECLSGEGYRRPLGHRRVAIFALASILIWPLYRMKYIENWGSIESTFIADGRFLSEHWPNPVWQPNWYWALASTTSIRPPCAMARRR